jgi:SM-20-related protein
VPGPGFFARLGLFVIRDFFSPDVCAKLREEASLTAQRPTMVINITDGDRVDENVRRSHKAKVARETELLVLERLMKIKSEVEKHFDVQLSSCEKPQFLVYREGDFFAAHLDSNDDPRAVEYMRERKISVVIFLNDSSDKAVLDSFSGGSLVFYELIDAPDWKKYGFPLDGEAGLLIAFPSKIFHEVTPVTCGERFTVVSWFSEAR